MNAPLQGTDQWLADRLGRVTASRVADVVARTKSGWGASRANYAAELIAERLTGVPSERFVTAPMQHGLDSEADAKAAYAFMAGRSVVNVGFVPHPRITMAGASPDGLVGDDGLVEIKSPNTATHLDSLLGGAIPDRYITQMQFQMACTGRAWCDWCSFDPRLPEHLQTVIRRVNRDGAAIAELERHVEDFLAEIDDKIGRLRRYGEASNLLMAG